METKKNKKYDLEQKRPVFFGIGMIISISLAITAFEWRSEIDPVITPIEEEENIFYMVDEVSITKHEKISLPPAPKPKIKKIVLDQIVESLDDDLKKKSDTEDVEIIIDDIIKDEALLPLPVEEAPFEVVEEMPSFPGGEIELLKFVAENIKYPKQAVRMGVEGRVHVQFVVEKDGSLSDVQVLRGIGLECDNEAIRVIQTIPNFNPGKQRGKPVRVKMVLPINFNIQ